MPFIEMPAVLPAGFFAFDRNHAICERFHVQLDGAHNEAKLSIISMLSSYPRARQFRPPRPWVSPSMAFGWIGSIGSRCTCWSRHYDRARIDSKDQNADAFYSHYRVVNDHKLAFLLGQRIAGIVISKGFGDLH